MNDTVPILRIIDQFGNEGVECYPIPHAADDPRDEPEPWRHDASRPTWAHLDRYAAWRRTKCAPVRRGVLGDVLRDLDQATHEFVGEVAETAEILLVHGPEALRVGTERRIKLVNECGDVFFTGSWLGDAWGLNPLLDVPGHDPARLLTDEVRDEMERRRLAMTTGQGGPDEARAAWDHHNIATIAALVQAGLLSNHFKKLRFQQRAQDRETIIRRLRSVLEWADRTLILADATAFDALFANIQKLDHRYPRGYVPGSGGGNRTGVGA